MVIESWKGGYKYFTIDLDDGEARMCLRPCKNQKGRTTEIDLDAYDVGIYPRGKIYYMEFIKVSPQYRNAGHGSALLRACVEWVRISNNIVILDAIPLDSGIESNRLIRFYLSHGFRMARSPRNKHSMYYHLRDKPRRPHATTRQADRLRTAG